MRGREAAIKGLLTSLLLAVACLSSSSRLVAATTAATRGHSFLSNAVHASAKEMARAPETQNQVYRDQYPHEEDLVYIGILPPARAREARLFEILTTVHNKLTAIARSHTKKKNGDEDEQDASKEKAEKGRRRTQQ